MCSVALLYEAMSAYDKAELLYHECLERQLEVLGSDHNDTLVTTDHLVSEACSLFLLLSLLLLGFTPCALTRLLCGLL